MQFGPGKDLDLVTSAQTNWWEQPYRIVQTNLRLIDASLDPEQLARQASTFGATAITFNVGGIYAFYPTELQLHARNPYLTRDLTGDMLEAAHKAGLRMVGRFDLSKGTKLAYDAHPEWFVHNKDGEPQEYNGTYQACVNGGWASDYSLQILREGLGRYAIDGAFFNMTGYQPVDYSGRYRGICHCENCQRGFRSIYGKPLPAEESFGDPSYRDYLEFKRRTSKIAAQRIYDTVKQVRPATGVMGNGHYSCDFMRLEIQRAVSRPAPEWPHQPGELARWAEAFGRGAAYACASTDFLDYQFRYASETAHNHMLRFGQTMANGGQVDFYVLGTFDQPNSEPMEPVRRFFEWHRAHGEHLAMTRSQARVGLYHSRASNLHAGATATGKLSANCFRGAYRLLLESRIPFDFVSDERMDDDDIAERLARFDVIVLSNTSCLSDREAAVLDTWVARGGTLLATGETALYDERGVPRDGFALQCFPASKLTASNSTLETYIAVAEDEFEFPQTRLLHLDGWFFHGEAKPDAVGALTLLPEQKYGPPELCFAENQAGRGPGLLSRTYGKGRAVWLPWLPEWLYFRDGLPEHRELLRQIITASKMPIKIEGAGAVEVTVRRTRNGQMAVHIVNYAGQRQSAYDEPPAIGGLKLGVLGAIGTATALVDGARLEFGMIDDEGYGWINLPDVKYFEIMLLSAEVA